jgi:hypothetical protein
MTAKDIIGLSDEALALGYAGPELGLVGFDLKGLLVAPLGPLF